MASSRKPRSRAVPPRARPAAAAGRAAMRPRTQQARLEIGVRLAEFAVAGLRQARYLVAHPGLDRAARGGTPGSGQEEFGAILLDPQSVGVERPVCAVLGARALPVEGLQSALCASVARQQLAAAARLPPPDTVGRASSREKGC